MTNFYFETRRFAPKIGLISSSYRTPSQVKARIKDWDLFPITHWVMIRKSLDKSIKSVVYYEEKDGIVLIDLFSKEIRKIDPINGEPLKV